MIRKTIFAIVLIASGYIAVAQTDLDDSVKKAASANHIKANLTSPFGAGPLSNFVSNVKLSSFFKQGVNGTVELNGKFKKGWTAGLLIDQKIGKADQEALPFSLTGISPGTTVLFNLQKMFGWHPAFDAESNEHIAKRMHVDSIYAKRNSIADFRTIGLRQISDSGTLAEKKMALAAFNDVSFKEPFFVNAKVGFTKTSFTYTTDSVNLTQASDAYITPTFTLSVVKTLGKGFNVSGYFALSYNYSINYIAADDVTFNIPFGTTANYYSNTLAFGKPAKQINNNIIAEFRKNIFINNGTDHLSNIAISPSVNLAIDSKTLAVFLPVYFIRGADEKGRLLDGMQGGVRFGYLSSTESGKASSFSKGFIAQLIISAPLDFLDIL